MKFTIRDLLWLTALVALGLAWWIDHHCQLDRVEQLREELRPQRIDFGIGGERFTGQSPAGALPID